MLAPNEGRSQYVGMDKLDKPHLLVVDDDERLRKLLSRFLQENGFVITTAKNALVAREMLENITFNLLILDVMMPGESGLELAQDILSQGLQTPILLLTAMGEVQDRIAGLEVGVDEYLPKPFEPRELLLRIRAILRRIEKMPMQTRNEVRIGHFCFNMDKDRLYKGEKEISLTQAEANLLKALARTPGEPLSREVLAEKSGLQANPRTIDVQMTRLRKKLEEDPKLPQYLQTVRNIGYVLWLH